jgi:hypothetical protein
MDERDKEENGRDKKRRNGSYKVKFTVSYIK